MTASSKVKDSTNVTLALGDGQPVCKHFQTVFCKFGDICRKKHVKETCKVKNCNKTCSLRHPKPCKYFAKNKFCKFGESCCYDHSSPLPVESQLQEQVKILQATVDSLAESLKALEAEILNLKKGTQCDLCDYTAASSVALKTHITKKHKEKPLPLPENERVSTSPCDSQNVSFPCVEREELEPVSNPHGAEARPAMMCEWIYCSYVAKSTSDMKEHVSSSHTITSSFVFPDSSEESDCEECGLTFLMDHNFAMHLYNNHNIGFECDHCHEYLPGSEGGFIEIHMKLCPAPCDGDPRCACKW